MMKKSDSMQEPMQYFLLFLPGLAIFLFAVAYPFFTGLHVSLTNWDGISQTMEPLGLKNYQTLLRSSAFWKALSNSAYFALLLTAGSNLLALLVALGLRSLSVARGALRAAIFFPTCLSAVLAAFIWKFIFRDVFSQLLGITSLLGNFQTVIPGIVIIALWNGLGINVVIYLTGLMNIPGDLYEAAIVDGANGLQKFRYITLPMLGPAITVCLTMTLTGGLKEFGTTMAATGGGPAGASEMISIYIYKNLYGYYAAGYGQAVAVVFVVLLVLCGGMLSAVLRRREVEA